MNPELTDLNLARLKKETRRLVGMEGAAKTEEVKILIDSIRKELHTNRKFFEEGSSWALRKQAFLIAVMLHCLLVDLCIFETRPDIGRLLDSFCPQDGRDFCLKEILLKAGINPLIGRILPEDLRKRLEEQLNDIDDILIIRKTVADIVFGDYFHGYKKLNYKFIEPLAGEEDTRCVTDFIWLIRELKLYPSYTFKYENLGTNPELFREIRRAIDEVGAQKFQENFFG